MASIIGRGYCMVAYSRHECMRQSVNQLRRLATCLSQRQLTPTGSPDGSKQRSLSKIGTRRWTSTMTTKASLDISGIYPPIVTSFDSDENIDYDKLRFNLNRWNDVPFRGEVYKSEPDVLLLVRLIYLSVRQFACHTLVSTVM
jgi:hypothetical protein